MSVELDCDLISLDFFEKAEVAAQGFESTLNAFDCVPLISSILSAPIRGGLGAAQIIAGFVALPFTLIADLFSNRRGEAFYRSGRAFSQIVHGLGNTIRASVVSLPLLGNILTIVYDRLGNRLSYRTESERPSLFNGVTNINPRLARSHVTV